MAGIPQGWLSTAWFGSPRPPPPGGGGVTAEWRLSREGGLVKGAWDYRCSQDTQYIIAWRMFQISWGIRELIKDILTNEVWPTLQVCKWKFHPVHPAVKKLTLLTRPRLCLPRGVPYLGRPARLGIPHCPPYTVPLGYRWGTPGGGGAHIKDCSSRDYTGGGCCFLWNSKGPTPVISW